MEKGTKVSAEYYKIYEFPDNGGGISILPISWVVDNTARFDDKKAPDYIRRGREPYKKWPVYKVASVSNRMFDSYEKAREAEKYLLDNSDIDTDFEKSASKRVVTKNKRYFRESSLSSYSDDEYRQDDFPSLDKSGNVGDYVEKGEEDPLVSRSNQILFDIEEEISQLSKPVDFVMGSNEETLNVETEIVQISKPVDLATQRDIKELKEMQLQCSKKLDTILELIQHTHLGFYNTETEKISFSDPSFPMKTIEEILQFEESLKHVEVGTRFKNFLMSLGGNNLKTIVKLIVSAVYDLNLQAKINWTGREKKKAVSELAQTKIIIEVMRIRGKSPLSDCMDEYKYHLQHASDRIRSASKKENKAVHL